MPRAEGEDPNQKRSQGEESKNPIEQAVAPAAAVCRARPAMDGHCQPKRIARSEGRSNGETEQQANDDLARLLPDDMLADVLRRLAPRWLAASRCVCKAWRDTVDVRRLLRADLLPLWLDGIIVEFTQREYSPEFFSRPGLPVGRKLENLTTIDVRDHCNGLLLSDVMDTGRYDYVSNPATGWKVRLPPCPSPCLAMADNFYYYEHLVFDPTLSTHYEVFRIPHLECELEHQHNPMLEKSEWPPSQLVMHVFSSVTGTWEERAFSREGEAAGTVADIRSKLEQRSTYLYWPGTVYWRGALYVNCASHFVMRICSSDSKYTVIKAPLGIGVNGHPELHLGRSEKGVYFASLCDLRIQVWILDESCGHLEWVLMHDNNFNPGLPRHRNNRQIDGPWILQTVKSYPDVLDILQGNHEALPEEKFGLDCPLRKDNFEWNSDGEDVPALDYTYMFQAETVVVLGFHPYKEIIFLRGSSDLGVAYHLNSSRFQVLGSLSGVLLENDSEKIIGVSFPYTPCWIEEFTGNC